MVHILIPAEYDVAVKIESSAGSKNREDDGEVEEERSEAISKLTLAIKRLEINQRP